MHDPAMPMSDSTQSGAGQRWFHVVRRGVGRRPIFPTAADIACFFELLARFTALGRSEVHACSILSNHCHLLVRSRPRDLSHDLRVVFGTYARHLNRRLHRDGPLLGNGSRVTCIGTLEHWIAAIAYIDRNAVEAGLAREAATYPFGSAWHYARGTRPAWLVGTAVEAHVRSQTGAAVFHPADYARTFADPSCAHARAVVERWLARPGLSLSPSDDLVRAARPEVRRWLERRAKAADGGAAGPALVASRALLEAIAAEKLVQPVWELASRGHRRSGPRRDGWKVVGAGLLRTAAGLALAEIAASLGISISGAHMLIRQHRDLMQLRPDYAARAQRLLSSALRRTHGATRAGEL